MNAVVLPVPAKWAQVAAPASEYSLDGLVLHVSAVQAVPEDPPAWMNVEAKRLAGAELGEPARVKTTTGWAMLIGDVAHGDERLMIALVQFLELAAVITLRGPAAAFATHVDDVKLALMQVRMHWGTPPVTISGLLSGVPAPKAQ